MVVAGVGCLVSMELRSYGAGRGWSMNDATRTALDISRRHYAHFTLS